MMVAPFKDLLEDGLVDLRKLERAKAYRRTELTLGIGIASVTASSPISSSMFLIRMERSATARSVDQ